MTRDDSQLDELVQRARGGDAAAFGELVTRFSVAVRGMCLLRAADPNRADDLAQQVFLTAWEKRSDLLPGAHFWPWLETITRNHLLNEWRRVHRERGMRQRYTTEWLIKQHSAAVSEGKAVQAGSMVDALYSCLDGLPANLRKMVTLRYFENQSAPQIASQMGQSPDGVRQTFVRVRDQLRQCMERKQPAKA
jgi:RNA polymerase sigma-70 factor, ECF subfamily